MRPSLGAAHPGNVRYGQVLVRFEDRFLGFGYQAFFVTVTTAV